MPVDRDGDHLPGKELAAGLEGVLDRLFQTAAAGDFHAHDAHALDVVVPDDGGELFRVVHVVQLGAADEGHVAAHELGMEVGIGVGGAVRCHQQVGAVVVGGLQGHELDLDRPLSQHTGGGHTGQAGHYVRRDSLGLKLAGLGAGTGVASGAVAVVGVMPVVFAAVRSGGGDVPFLKGDGAHRAVGQAVAQAIAVILLHQHGLAVHQSHRALQAGVDAGAAAHAFVSVKMSDFLFHSREPPQGVSFLSSMVSYRMGVKNTVGNPTELHEKFSGIWNPPGGFRQAIYHVKMKKTKGEVRTPAPKKQGEEP